LAADSVTLVDGAGNLLAEPSDPGAAGLSASDSETYRAALEDRLRGKLVQLTCQVPADSRSWAVSRH